jgi:PAS domain-containing protein
VQDLAHVGGWEWDATSELVYLTNEAQRMLGLGRTTASIDELQACLRETERKRFHDALTRAVDHDEGFELELQGIRADGHTLWIRIIGESEAGDPTARD